MAAIAGRLSTRILVATGDAEPTELATFATTLHATGTHAGVTIATRRLRRDLTLAFLRCAWHTLTHR